MLTRLTLAAVLAGSLTSFAQAYDDDEAPPMPPPEEVPPAIQQQPQAYAQQVVQQPQYVQQAPVVVQQQVVAAPQGQWVYTSQYGWVWMPYAAAYVSTPTYGNSSMYVYRQSFGWGWVGAPWLGGAGPRPWFGVYGGHRFGWYSSPSVRINVGNRGYYGGGFYRGPSFNVRAPIYRGGGNYHPAAPARGGGFGRGSGFGGGSRGGFNGGSYGGGGHHGGGHHR